MAVNYEARVLSALLKRQDMISIMGEPLEALMETYGDVWAFIEKYYQRNRELPPPSVVVEQFSDFEYDEDIEGATQHHIEVLRTKSIKAKTEELLKKSSEELAKNKFSPNKIVDHLAKRLSDIQRTAGVARVVDVRDYDDALSHYDKIRQLSELNDGQPGIPFGFNQMDKAYPKGMSPGDLIIYMGYSGHFKSWFAIKTLINAWLKGYSAMLINLEMSPEELRDRIYFFISQYSMTDLMRAEIDPENFKAWAEDFMAGKAEFHLVGNDTFGDFDVNMIHAKVEQYKPKVIVLDYMGLFTDREHSQNETVRMKNLSRQLKQLATVCKLPVIAITAVTGRDKKDRLNPPDIAQVSYSSGIEYDANLAIAVHTHFNPTTLVAEKTEIVCRKNRSGPKFDFFVKIDMDTGVVVEMDEDEQIAMVNDDDDIAWLDD